MSDNEPFRLHEFVQLAVHEKNVLPDRVWDMTLPELCLFMTAPEEKTLTVTNAIEGQVICLELDDRINRIKALTFDERIELEQWKADLM